MLSLKEIEGAYTELGCQDIVLVLQIYSPVPLVKKSIEMIGKMSAWNLSLGCPREIRGTSNGMGGPKSKFSLANSEWSLRLPKRNCTW